MRMVVVVGTAISAQIAHAHDKTGGSKDLSVETRHAERLGIKWNWREGGRSGPLRIGRRPYPDNGRGFCLAGCASFIECSDRNRQRAVGLSRDQEVADIAVATQRSDPVALLGNGRRGVPSLRRGPGRYGLRAARDENVLLDVSPRIYGDDHRWENSRGCDLKWNIRTNCTRPQRIQCFDRQLILRRAGAVWDRQASQIKESFHCLIRRTKIRVEAP